MAKSNAIAAERVAHEACRRLIKGMASGAVTFDLYRKWLLAPPGEEITLPDYR